MGKAILKGVVKTLVVWGIVEGVCALVNISLDKKRQKEFERRIGMVRLNKDEFEVA